MRLAMFLVVLMLACTMSYADSVGFSYSEILGDRALGVTADYTKQLGKRVTLEADAQVQAGDVYNARLNTNFVIDVSAIDLKVLIENKAKGYTLATLGREQNIGLALTVPIDDLNVDVGVGGKNANPFAAPTALDTLSAAGFADADIQGKGLEVITPAPKGLPLTNGNAVNAFLSTNFTKGAFDIGMKGIVELISQDDRIHQVNTTIKTSGNVLGTVVTTALEVALATQNDVISYETAIVSSVGFDF